MTSLQREEKPQRAKKSYFAMSFGRFATDITMSTLSSLGTMLAQENLQVLHNLSLPVHSMSTL